MADKLPGYDDWLDNYGNPGIQECNLEWDETWGLICTVHNSECMEEE